MISMKSLNLNDTKLNSTKRQISKKNSRKTLKFLFIIPTVLLIAVVVSFSYFYATDKRSLEVFLTSYIGEQSSSKLVFETYTVNLNGLNDELAANIRSRLSEIKHGDINRYQIVDSENADIFVESINTSSKGVVELDTHTLLPVGHLYWIKDEVLLDEVNGKSILIEAGSEENVALALKRAGISAELVSTTNMLMKLKESEDMIGFISLDNLSYEYKLLKLDGEYYLDSLDKGRITYSLGLNSSNAPEFIQQSLSEIISEFEVSEDLKPEEVLKVNMTGVTAITRALAIKTDQSGRMDYASEKIGSFLADADLTHTSNEISFLEGCKPSAGLQFCSDPSYISALEASGIDIVELTGNHNNDFGSQANADTIETYKSKGWDYFGGGLNIVDASKILYKEVEGVKLAFIGYNYYDTVYKTGAIAAPDRAGANSYSEDKMKIDIEEAKSNGAIAIVDFQFQECYSYPQTDVIYPICYKPLSNPDQKAVFRNAIDLGADLVIGVQAHQPQTYELYNGKPIFYGLGNLYFDQVPWIGTRQGLVLTHYFVGDRHLQTKVTTTIYNEDMQTYVTEGEERKLLLELLRDAR
jgi:hypothetical protein